MNIFTSRKAIAAATALVLGLGIAGASATAAVAADPAEDGYWTPQGTAQPFYLYSLETNERVAATDVLKYDDGYFGSPDPTNPDALFADGPEDATGIDMFISPRGKEGDMTMWNSRFEVGFNPGTRSLSSANPSLASFPAHSFGAVKAAGGEYSIGFAFTKYNGAALAAVGSYIHVVITPGTADWTFSTPQWVGGETEPPVGPQTGQIGIEATTVAVPDGALSLTVPAGAKATLGAATLVNGLSTSTGTLSTFTVNDARVVTKPGWTVNSSVSSFVKGTDSFGADALSVTPAVVAAGTTSTGVTTAAKFAAASTAAKFAEAAAGAGVGITALNAELSLVAPATAPAGTYTSTMTVTVVSK